MDMELRNEAEAYTLHRRHFVFLDTSLEVRAEPLETFVQTISRSSTCSLDEPLSLPQAVETQLVGDLGCVHCVWQILLVGEDKE